MHNLVYGQVSLLYQGNEYYRMQLNAGLMSAASINQCNLGKILQLNVLDVDFNSEYTNQYCCYYSDLQGRLLKLQMDTRNL